MGAFATHGSTGRLREAKLVSSDVRPRLTESPARLAPNASRKRGNVMHGKTTRASVCVAVALLGIVVAGCGKGYRQVVVIEGAKAEFITFGPPPKEAQQIWAPGRVLVFRSNSPVPGGPEGVTGQTGHVYRVNEQNQLEEIGQFELTIPNDTLAYRYGK
jgi:hypothetical protein